MSPTASFFDAKGVHFLARARKRTKSLLQRKDAESILVRVPLIPGYNTAEDQKKSAEKLREMGVKRLDLFEYRTKVKG